MSRLFTKVPIMINYHRCLLSGKEFSDTDTDVAADMVKRAVAKGFCLRHDAFGMKQYYKDWERGISTTYHGIVPITMEGGWVLLPAMVTRILPRCARENMMKPRVVMST